ncbi:MAG: hypothetical protein AAF917_00675 [Pseudomonadota bacterium]
MTRFASFFILILMSGAALAQGSDYRDRWVALNTAAETDGDTQGVEILVAFFGISAPDFDDDDSARAALEGISDDGWAIIRAAREAEARHSVDELNCNKLAVAKLCQILIDNPTANARFIAEQKAVIHELPLQRKLNRYNAVYQQLSDADRVIVSQFNEVIFGRPGPEVPQRYSEMLMTVADEFPGYFVADQNDACFLERSDDEKVLLPADLADVWQSLEPLAQCRETQQYAQALMLVCPENHDPQDEVESCESLLNPDAEAPDP